MIAGTLNTMIGEKWHQFLGWSLIHAISRADRIQFVKHFENQRAGRVNGAHDCASLLSQTFQQGNAAGARRAIQTTTVSE